MATLAIDLETYSDNDIKYGVYKYVDSPNFEILLLGYSFDDEPVQVVDLTKEGMPVRLPSSPSKRRAAPSPRGAWERKSSRPTALPRWGASLKWR